MLICNHFPVIVVFLKLPLSSTVNIWSSLMVDLRDKNMAERLRIKGLLFRLPYHVWVCQILSVDSHSICQGMRLEKKITSPVCAVGFTWVKTPEATRKEKEKIPNILVWSFTRLVKSRGQKNVILFYRSFSSLLKIAQKLPKTIRCWSLVGFHDQSFLYR